VNLNAGTDITTTPQGIVDMRASGIGDGGFFSASAGGNINLVGNILANGSAADEACGAGGCRDGGTGGDVLVSANGSVVMSGRVELNGAGRFDTAVLGDSVDGDGGSVDITAGTTINVSGPHVRHQQGLRAERRVLVRRRRQRHALRRDRPDERLVRRRHHRAVRRPSSRSAHRLRTATPIDPVNRPSSLGGTIDIEGCKFNLLAAGSLVSTGPGGSPSGATFLAASTQLTVSGPVTSTAENEFDWRTSPPVITGTVSPLPTLIQT
jgi:hypothetical protein